MEMDEICNFGKSPLSLWDVPWFTLKEMGRYAKIKMEGS